MMTEKTLKYKLLAGDHQKYTVRQMCDIYYEYTRVRLDNPPRDMIVYLIQRELNITPFCTVISKEDKVRCGYQLEIYLNRTNQDDLMIQIKAIYIWLYKRNPPRGWGRMALLAAIYNEINLTNHKI